MNRASLHANMPREIRAIVEFGSRARGDFDEYSDTDVAVFADVCDPDSLLEVRAKLDRLGWRGVCFSCYSVDAAESMAKAGSLFLWHLRTEGKVRFSRDEWLGALLQTELASYSLSCAQKGARDLLAVIEDIRLSVSAGASTLPFEAATLYAVLRTLGMMVAMVQGRPCFERLGSIFNVNSLLDNDLRINDEEVDALVRARLSYSRAAPFDLDFLDQTILIGLCRKASNVVGSICNL